MLCWLQQFAGITRRYLQREKVARISQQALCLKEERRLPKACVANCNFPLLQPNLCGLLLLGVGTSLEPERYREKGEISVKIAQQKRLLSTLTGSSLSFAKQQDPGSGL